MVAVVSNNVSEESAKTMVLMAGKTSIRERMSGRSQIGCVVDDDDDGIDGILMSQAENTDHMNYSR